MVATPTFMLITPGELRKFTPFARLGPEQLISLAHEIVVQHVPPGQCLIALGASDVDDYFLVSGEVLLTGRSGQQKLLKSELELAKEPLTMMRPSQYDISAHTETGYFTVPSSIVEILQHEAPKTEDEIGEMTMSLAARRHPIFLDFRHELKNNNLVLPTMPAVAVRVRQAIDKEDSDVRTVAKLVGADPAIAAKLIKVSNSPLYRGQTTISSCDAAVTRLGLHTTKELVACYSYRDLFKSQSSDLKERMQKVWQHSVDVAAISHVLAGMTDKFNSEKAMLAGLLHDIGVLPILYFLDVNSDHIDSETEAESVIHQLRADIGSMTLSKWGFDNDLINAVEHADDWSYQSSDDVDYADVVIIAQLHSFVGKKTSIPHPRMDTVPAFNKIAGGKIDPQASMGILEQAQEQIAETRQLLAL